MKNGTIIYIGGFKLPDKNAAAHRVINNAKIFKDLGYSVVFITNNRELIHNKKTNYLGFECWEMSVEKNKLGSIKILFNVKNLIEIFNHYNDIKYIIGYNFPSIPMLKIKKYCSNRKIRLIGDITEWYGTKNKNIFYKIFKGLDTSIRMKFVNNKLDGLIVISSFLKGFYKSTNVLFLPPLVDLMDEKWGKEEDLINKKIKLVYAGSPSKEKERLDIVVQAVNDLCKDYFVELEIIGINKKQYKEIYKVSDDNMNKINGNSIKFYGRLDHNSTLKIVKDADYTVIVREDSRLTRAGFPTKFVESVTCGTPVISTNNSDLKKYITKDENGFIVSLEYFKKELEEIISSRTKPIVNNKKFNYKNYKIETAIFLKKLI